ncbi:hypothetical protein [Pukyongiella litopenaei]|uniref:3-methyladenine DNA glycosylase AlkC n=1 Tax=Pukyongiella litopenaei TaxID=2605946 RepID=A0A2S0MMI5_9RHOB|nr:hypothetical protein [Pukyongiella litopenaei]AVO37090.1 hypothetical protein C6Y53_04800 [Pukyongiella litopenaei]
MASGFSLKDQLFNRDKVRYLGGLMAGASADFDAAAFEAAVMSRLPELELKARMRWIAECLAYAVPGPLPQVAPVIRAALPPPLDPDAHDGEFGDFIHAPFGDWVAELAGPRDTALALDLLADITQRFSMEWAVRPFLTREPAVVLARMRDWTTHPSVHVRRLASEGSRPRLPWGQAVGLAPGATLPILDALHGDRARYVTRSVANHLNDIARSDPQMVLDRLGDWRGRDDQAARELAWMAGHALRGLVKAGHPGAMAALGFDPDAAIVVEDFAVPGRVAIGEMLMITATLRADAGARALVDCVFRRRRADGSEGRKVIKLKQLTLPPGEQVEIAKAHRLKGDATTFRLHPGPQGIDLMSNGRLRAQATFELTGA